SAGRAAGCTASLGEVAIRKNGNGSDVPKNAKPLARPLAQLQPLSAAAPSALSFRSMHLPKLARLQRASCEQARKLTELRLLDMQDFAVPRVSSSLRLVGHGPQAADLEH